jgi:hypothetical protein
MTDVNFTTDETGNIVLTPEQHNLLLKGSREGIAISAGMDMDNPTSQLVLDQHWTPETTVAEMEGWVEQYKVGKPVVIDDLVNEKIPDSPEGKVEERNGPEGSVASGDVRSTLANGTSVPGNTQILDPDSEAKQTFDKLTNEGVPAEDARVASLDTLLSGQGAIGALDRIRSRQRDEEVVATAMAAHENAQAGNL